MIRFSKLNFTSYQIINSLIIIGSVTLCLLLLLSRLPGMELLGISPHWLLIWMVAWSVKRNVWQAAIAGVVLGLIQDGMTAPQPSHVLSLVVVGVLTARMQKQKYIQEDFISTALIVFGMVIVGETVTAIQYIVHGYRDFAVLWESHQRIILASAILSSLWTPVLSYPLNRWWDYLKGKEKAL